MADSESRGHEKRIRRLSCPGIVQGSCDGREELQTSAVACQTIWHRRQSICDFRPRAHKATFFQLPTELQAQILVDVSFADLAAFRQTCRKAARVLAAGEIARQWINRHIDKDQVNLFPVPTLPTFRYIMEQRNRFRAATDVAAKLAEYLEKNILHFTLSRFDVFPTQTRHAVVESTKAQLRDKMVPLLLGIQHYLESCADVLSYFATPALTMEELEARLFAQQRRTLENYEPERLLEMHKFWLFLSWYLRQIIGKQPPSWPVELCIAYKFWDSQDFNLLMIFGNIRALRDLMESNSNHERRVMLRVSLDRLYRHEFEMWHPHWEVSSRPGAQRPMDWSAVQQLALGLSRTDLWVGEARRILFEKGLIPNSGASEQVGTSWQMIDLLCDAAGYDVLRNPPSI